MKKVFVDGYNVINSWKELKDLPLSAARDQLVEYMINYASFYDVSISVVFDAHRVSGRSQHKELKAKVEVVYTKDSETAQVFGFLWTFPLVFASSVFVPVDTMPGWLQAFALPIHRT